jgi:hypothetical protein
MTDRDGRRWVNTADLATFSKRSFVSLRAICPEADYFQDEERPAQPARCVPVDRVAAILGRVGVAQIEAEAIEARLVLAPLSGRVRLVNPRKPAPQTEPAHVEVAEPPPAPSSAMVARAVDGWTLFEGAGGTWVMDLDLAARAGKEPARDIRKVIKTAIEDGGLADLKKIGALAGRANGTPGYRTEIEMATSGKGKQDATTVYYLNQEGALLILTRLRTLKAIEVTKACVMVFAKVMRGEVTAPRLSGEMAEMRQMLRETIASIPAMIEQTVKAMLPTAQPAPHAPRPRSALVQLPAIPPDPEVFFSPSTLGVLLTKHLQRRIGCEDVGRAITACGLRSHDDLCKWDMVKGRGVDRMVSVALWKGSIWPALVSHFKAGPPQQPLPYT